MGKFIASPTFCFLVRETISFRRVVSLRDAGHRQTNLNEEAGERDGSVNADPVNSMHSCNPHAKACFDDHLQ